MNTYAGVWGGSRRIPCRNKSFFSQSRANRIKVCSIVLLCYTSTLKACLVLRLRYLRTEVPRAHTGKAYGAIRAVLLSF